MEVLEMVVLIVAICVGGAITLTYFEKKYPKFSKDTLDNLMDNLGLGDEYFTKKDMAQFLEKFKAMEERLQVLERIATNSERNLASEIDNLK